MKARNFERYKLVVIEPWEVPIEHKIEIGFKCKEDALTLARLLKDLWHVKLFKKHALTNKPLLWYDSEKGGEQW